MELFDRINADLKTAMLGGDKVATGTLRLLKTELKNAEISSGAELDEKAVQQIIRKEAKKRRESVELYVGSGNSEQAEQESQEAAILEAYLPAQATSADVEAFVNQLKAAAPALNKGEAIKQTIAYFAGNADGKTVSEIVGRLF